MKIYIQHTRELLLADLSNPDGVADRLYSKGVMTALEHERVRSKQNRHEKCQELLDIVAHKNVGWVDTFIEAVIDSSPGQEDFIKALKRAKAEWAPTPITIPMMSTSTSSASASGEAPSKAEKESSLRQAVSLLKGRPSGALPEPRVECKNKAPMYELKSTPLGRVLIINNIKFHEGGNPQKERTGAENDSKRLETLFLGLSMEVVSEENVTGDNFQWLLQLFKKSFKTNPVDVSIVIVMSHGGEGDVIYTADNQRVQIHADIVNAFSNDNFREMIGKPKIFIFQSCRGEKTDFGTTQKDSSTSSIYDAYRIPTIPSWTDMLICYSTLDGHYAYRETDKGSWFIQTLCDVFTTHASEHHVYKLLHTVSERMKARNTEVGEKQMCPWTNIGFDKKLYLVPRTGR